MKIIFKILLPVLSVLALVVLVLQTYVSVAIQRALIADEIVRTIESVRTASALTDDVASLTERINDPRIFRIKIWDGTRTVVWSDEPDLIGSVASRTPLDRAFSGEAFGLTADAALLEPPEEGLDAIIKTFVPIEDARGEVAYVVETSTMPHAVIAPVEGLLDAAQIGWILATALIVIALIVTNALFVTVPVRRLRAALHATAEGHLDQPVRIDTFDEFGILALDLERLRYKLKGSLSDLRKQEGRYRNIVEYSPQAIAVHQDEKVIFVNEAMARLLGAPDRQALIGQSIYGMIHPDFRAIAAERIRDLNMKRKRAPLLEEKFIKLDGTPIDVAVTGIPFVYDGKPSVQMIVVDISERKRVEERTRALDELKNSFIRVVSHQMRTPLNSIRWSLESLLSESAGKLKKGQKDILSMTHEADVEIIRRLEDVLSALDLKEGRIFVSKETSSLAGLVEVAIEKWKRLGVGRHLQVSYEKPQGSLELKIDAPKIRLAVDRLIENAFTYTPVGGNVTVSLRELPGGARFECADTGIGIPSAERNRIFVLFSRASNASDTYPNGSGIGLYLAKNFIEQHGGKIGFSSREGRGSTFWFELPAG